MIAALDKCQKSLTQYLRNKRIIFPRFNFISDDELLSILGSGNPTAIQEHIGKMFDNLDKFTLVPDHMDRLMATALVSCEKEIMDFRNPVSTEGQIEIWMGLALEEMKRSNRYLTKKAVYNYGKVNIKSVHAIFITCPRKNFFLRHLIFLYSLLIFLYQYNIN